MTLAEHKRRYPEVWEAIHAAGNADPLHVVLRHRVHRRVVAEQARHYLGLYFLDAHEQAWDLVVRMVPPDWAFFADILDPLVETVHIATLGTVATFFIAMPIAFLAARNTTPNAVTWFIGRFILVASRSVNTIVWGLLFVAIFGPGPMAGICRSRRVPSASSASSSPKQSKRSTRAP